ncbi:MAG: hypothetical protein ACYDC6_15965, partial [Acidobacteriaceae bacterium]
MAAMPFSWFGTEQHLLRRIACYVYDVFVGKRDSAHYVFSSNFHLRFRSWPSFPPGEWVGYNRPMKDAASETGQTVNGLRGPKDPD